MAAYRNLVHQFVLVLGNSLYLSNFLDSMDFIFILNNLRALRKVSEDSTSIRLYTLVSCGLSIMLVLAVSIIFLIHFTISNTES